MNLILFEPHELAAPLPRTDRRARHIRDVLHRGVGESFDVGLIDGPRGKAVLEADTADGLSLRFEWGPPPSAPRAPLTLIVGLPRPQTARDILRDATTLGVAALHFVRTERSDPNYASSTLWTTDEWRRHAIAGAEQAFDPRLPSVTHNRALADALASAATMPARLALDNYEPAQRLGACDVAPEAAAVLAIGPERGWSAADRALLREHGFMLAHLGERILRTESAVIAAISLVRARQGLM